ncbi:TonB-dependent receptor [Bordetella sp. BOR01]|uniref:TonB-dependent receptor n=1 Tax=Bordetella sp. BOR01 TaxID=2854779 RepID=UPI001C459722|nr:TonB-dependent hemoglobin/transferrin/lactoferrin family receptor [Bordetella sp. BOR01]
MPALHAPRRYDPHPLHQRTALAAAVRGAMLAIALMGGLGMAAGPARAQTAQAAPPLRTYQVPAGELGAALARFADQAGITVLFQPDAVRGRHSAGLQGAYPVPEALRRLLDGTGLAARERGNGAYVLLPQEAAVTQLAPVMVEAEAPRTEPAWTSTTTRQELDGRQVRNWEDVGKRLDAGVNFNRQNNSINIRGVDGDRVATRIDGIRLPWLDDGARGVKGGLNAVSFDTLSRLDIVRGTDSASVGSGALGGAAELRTLDPDDLLPDGRDFGALLKGDYDSADTSRAANAALAGRLQANTTWLLQAGIRKGHELDNRADQGGYGPARSRPDPEDYTQRNVLLKLQQRIDGGHRFGLTGELFRYDSDSDSKYLQGPDTSYLEGENSATENIERKRVSLDYEYQAPRAGGPIDTARAVVYWQRLRLDKGLDAMRSVDARASIIPGDPFRYGFPSGAYGRDNSIQETLFGVNGEATRRVDGSVSQLWTVGAEWMGNRTEQYSGGYDNCPDVPAGLPAPFGPRACDMLHTNQADMPRVKGSQWAVWAQNEIGFAEGRYTLMPALRYDHYEQKPQATDSYDSNPNAGGLPPSSSGGRFSPRLLGTWKAREQVTLYAQYAYGYKAPSATELYTNYGGPGTYLRVGNPYLKPESSRGWELGARLGNEQLGGALSFFDTRYQDFIDKQVPLGPDSPQWQDGWAGQYPLGVTGVVNRARVRIYGAEASAHWRFAPGWRTWGSLAWTVGKDQGTGQYLNSVPPLKAILGLGYERDRWGVDAMLTTATRRNKVEYPDAAADAPNPDFRAPGYGVVDLMAYWKPAAVKGLQVRAGVFNLLDKKYWEAINVPTAGAVVLPRPVDWYTEPGRSVRISLTYQY